jgi:CUG-BP- and ETR3-like factor
MSQVPGVLKSKVFIGCVPATVEEAELKQILSRFGKLIGLFYCRDSGASDRGFSIVTYSSETEAAAAISGGNGQSLFENAIRPAQVKLVCDKITSTSDPNSVFTDPGRPLPSAHWEEYTSDEGFPYYYNKDTGETVWEKPKYYTEKAAAPMPPPDFAGGTILPPSAASSSPANGYGPLGANLFVFHIPSDWNDDDLRAKFAPFGELLSAKVQVEEGTNRSRGFGFISYTTREAAANAVHVLNGSPLCGKHLKVNIKKGEEQYAVAPTEPAPAHAQATPPALPPPTGSIQSPPGTVTGVVQPPLSVIFGGQNPYR